MQFLTTNSLLIAAVVLLIPTTILAMGGPVIVRRYVPLDRLKSNNQVAGFKFATVGVIYAVLLAFAIFLVWGRFNQAANEVANEASAAATVLRLTDDLGAPHSAAVRKATIDYLKEAVAKDWPAMDRGTSSPDVTMALSEIYNAALKEHTSNVSEAVVVAAILRTVDRISEMRRQRLVVANGVVPGIIWTVLFVGAFVTIGFTFLFRHHQFAGAERHVGSIGAPDLQRSSRDRCYRSSLCGLGEGRPASVDWSDPGFRQHGVPLTYCNIAADEWI